MSFLYLAPSKGASARLTSPPLAVKPPTRPISIEATSGAPLPAANEVSSLSWASAKGVLTKLTLIVGSFLVYSSAQILPASSHHQKVISVTAVLPCAGAAAAAVGAAPAGASAAGAAVPPPQAANKLPIPRPLIPAAATRRNLRREIEVTESLLVMIVAFFLSIVGVRRFVVVGRPDEASYCSGLWMSFL